MPLSEILGIAMLLTIIILSVALAARFIKLLDETISKTVIIILCIPIMLVFTGIGWLSEFLCKKIGITNDKTQIIIAIILIGFITFFTNRGLTKIYKRK